MKNHPVVSFVLAVGLGYFLFTAGIGVSINFLSHSTLPQPSLLRNAAPHPVTDLLGALVAVLGVAAVAGIVRGPFLFRWLYLVFFMYSLGYVLSTWESAYFTKFGGTQFLLALWVLPCLLCAFGLTLFLKPPGRAEPLLQKARDYFQSRPPKHWLWRLILAWLSFPAIYLLFGFCVAPIVRPYYQSLDFLVLPPMGFLIQLQLIRSLLILATVLPLFIYGDWPKARLIPAFCWAFYALTGLSGMVGAYFFPMAVRWAHGVETLMDAVAYGTLAVLLLAMTRRSRE